MLSSVKLPKFEAVNGKSWSSSNDVLFLWRFTRFREL